MGPFSKEKSSLDKILWAVIFIAMVANSLGGRFSLGAFFLMPAPLIIMNVLISPVNAVILILGATVLFAVEHGMAGGLAFFLLIGVFSQIQGFMIRRNSRVSRILFWGMIFVLAAGLLLISIGTVTGTADGYSVLNGIKNDLDTAIQGSAYGESLTSENVAGFFPAFVMYLIFIFNGANFFLSRWVLQNRGVNVIQLGNLSEFQLPQHIFGGILLLFAMSFVMRIAGWYGVQVMTDTLIYLTAFVFMFQGLAICSYYLKQLGIPPVWQNIVLAALTLLAGPVGLGLAGLTDVLADLRKQRRTGGNRG